MMPFSCPLKIVMNLDSRDEVSILNYRLRELIALPVGMKNLRVILCV